MSRFDGILHDEPEWCKSEGTWGDFYVCRTGDKEVFYTLWVTEYYKMGESGFCKTYFVQNLSHKLDDAVAKAEMIRENYLARGFQGTKRLEARARIQYSETPRKKVEPYFDIGLGEDFQLKMNRGQTLWWNHANEAFWAHWRENKLQLKAEGIWVSKIDYQWMVFRRVAPEEIGWLDDDGYDLNADVEVSA